MDIPSFLCQAVVATLVLIAAVWAPGRLLLRLLRLPLEPEETLACSLACGTSLLALVYWILYLLHLPFLVPGYAIICLLIELWQIGHTAAWRKPIPQAIRRPIVDYCRQNWPLLAILALSLFSQARFLFAGGWFGVDGLIFPSFHAHDGPDHISLIHQLTYGFPPEVNGFAGVKLVNYHYFTDLFWGAVSRMGSIDPWHIYFRIAPLFYAFFAVLAAFAVGRALYGDRRIAFLATFICVLVSDFGYFLPLLMRSGNFPTWDGIFMVQPPLTGMAGLTAGSAYPLTLMVFWAFVSWMKRRRHVFLVLLALLGGVLPEFKIYPAALITTALLVVGTFRLIFKRDWTVLQAFFAVLPLNIILFCIFNSGSASLVRFMPGFNSATFLVLTKIVTPQALVQFYANHPVLLALIMGGLIVVFTIGTLGIRCVALPNLIRAAIFPRSSDPLLLFLAVLTGGALVASMCFIQTGVPPNTLESFNYSVLLLAFPAAEQIWSWVSRWAPFPRLAAIVLFLGLGLPGTIQAWFASGLVKDKYSLSKSECDALLWIRHNTAPNEILLRPLPPELLTAQGYTAWLSKAEWRNKRTLEDWRKVAENYKVGGGVSDTNAPAGDQRQAGPHEGRSVQVRQTTDASSKVAPVAWGDTAYVAATTFRRTYVESMFTARAMLMNDEPEKRVQEVRHFYLDSSAQEARRFLKDNGITIVIQAAHRQLPFSPASLPLSVVYSNEAMVVYRFDSTKAW